MRIWSCLTTIMNFFQRVTVMSSFQLAIVLMETDSVNVKITMQAGNVINAASVIMIFLTANVSCLINDI